MNETLPADDVRFCCLSCKNNRFEMLSRAVVVVRIAVKLFVT